MNALTRTKCFVHKSKQSLPFLKKKGEDRSLLENWRPISRVNEDKKITSKAIDTRIKNIKPHIIDQIRYVKDRFISETIRPWPSYRTKLDSTLQLCSIQHCSTVWPPMYSSDSSWMMFVHYFLFDQVFSGKIGICF